MKGGGGFLLCSSGTFFRACFVQCSLEFRILFLMTFKHSHQPSQHRLSAHILTYHSCTQSVHVNMDSSSQTIHPQVADEEPRRHQDEQQQSRSLLLSDGVIRAIFLLLGGT